MTSPCEEAGQGSPAPQGDAAKQAREAGGAAAGAAGVANVNEAAAPIVVSLLHALTSSDNSARNRAEQAFNELKQGQPEALLYGLLEGIGSKHVPPHVRSLAAVLLRRALLVEEPTLWDCLPAASDMGSGRGAPEGGVGVGAEVGKMGQRELQACLLQILSDEGDASVRRKVGDLVGELGRAVLDEDGPEGWPEFLPYVLQSASSSSTLTATAAAAAAAAATSGNANTPAGAQRQLQQLQLSDVVKGGGVETAGTPDAWARVVTGLRLMSSAAQHTALAAAADPSAFKALVETLQRCLSWQGGGEGGGAGSPDVRLEAVRALGSVVVACERPSDQASFSTCLPHLLQAIQATLSSGDRNSESRVWYCCETLELVVELAEVCPAFLRPRVSQCVAGMVQVAGDRSVETSVRHLALEFLVSIVEASPAMCRKMPGRAVEGDAGAGAMGGGGGAGAGGDNAFATSVIPVCFSMMTELPENESWAMGETEEEDSVEDNVCEVGSEALERVARALGARAALPVCRQLVKEGLAGWAWQHQHAALSALGILADVFNQPQGEEGLEIRTEALSQLLPFIACSRPRVQHASLWALERMAEDQSPELQEEHHEVIVPALLACIDPNNGGCPRVLHRALLTLAVVVEACPEGGVMPHAEALLERCVMLIRQGPVMVQEAAVALVSAAAEAGEDEDFGRFYDVVMPFLLQILSSCPGQEQRLLRGKALECVSLVGATAGKERFGVDALSVMQLMVQAQASGLDDDDPTRVYMLRAWVRICKCLGPDFVPYLPLVMPPLLAAASANVEVELPSGGADSDGADVDELDSDVDCMEGLDGEVVAVRTWALEEQATACQMILLLAEALQEHFLPYVEAVAGQLARLVNSSPHDDVRTFCMAAMPELVRACGKAAVMPGSDLQGGRVRQLLEFCLCRLVESLDKEEDAELLMTAAQACKRCVYYACVRWEVHTEGMDDPTDPRPSTCRRVLNEDQSRVLARAALGCLGQSLRRRALRRAEATASEDWDEEEEERAQAAGEEEVELHVNLAELLGFLFKTHGEAFFPAFEELLLPSVLEMARPDSLPEDRKVAVHVLDHALEFANPAACVILPSVVPLLLEACADQAPSVTLPALFGVGVSAATYGPGFAPFSGQALKVLIEVILRPDARQDGREMATDNAVSALGNLLEAQRDTLSNPDTGVGGEEAVGRAWGVWLGYMPLRADDEEAEKVAQQLCRLLTASSSLADARAVLGSRLERLPLALAALAEMAGSELIGPEVRQQVGQAILMLQAGGGHSGGVLDGGGGDRVPVESFAAAAAGLGAERKSWLDAAAAEFTALCHHV